MTYHLYHHHLIILYRHLHCHQHLIIFFHHNRHLIYHRHHHHYLTICLYFQQKNNTAQPSATRFREQVIIKTKQPKTKQEKIIEDTDTSIYEIPEPSNLELGDPLLIVLSTDVEDILKSNYVTDTEIEDKTIEQIKDEYNFLIFLSMNFFAVVTMIILSLNEDNNEFVSF